MASKKDKPVADEQLDAIDVLSDLPRSKPLSPVGPSTALVIGAAAHDPNVPSIQNAPAKLVFQVWARTAKLKPVSAAGFGTWAQANCPSQCTAAEWAAHFARFNASPVR